MKNQGLIELIDYFEDKKIIIMEFAENGTLHDYLMKQNSPIGMLLENPKLIYFYLDWSLRLIWSIQLIEGVIYLHSKNIIHRDLRCVNILVKKLFCHLLINF